MLSSQQNVSARRRFPEKSQPASCSSHEAADTSLQIPDPQNSKPARPLSSAEREDNIQKRQRPAQVYRVLAIAGGDSRIEIATLTDDQKALHTAKQQGLLNMDKFGVVEVFDRPQSQPVLSARRVSDTTAGRMWHGGLSKLSVLMQIFVLQERQSSRLCEDFSPLLQFTEIQLRSEIVTVRFMNHRCRVSQNQWYVEPAPEVQLDSSKMSLRKKALQALKISPQARGIHSTQNINDMSYDQLRYPMYVKKRTQRLDHWILDDVVGTGPDEHLMSDFEHMKTSLYLTDVVVLRHDGDAVSFWGLEITKTSKGFEVKKVQTSWNPL